MFYSGTISKCAWTIIVNKQALYDWRLNKEMDYSSIKNIKIFLEKLQKYAFKLTESTYQCYGSQQDCRQ